MDEQFTNKKDNSGHQSRPVFPGDTPEQGSKDFTGYFEQRSKKVEGFTLKLSESEPGAYKPKYAAPQHSDVFSYSESGADRKQADYMELAKSMEESRYDNVDDYYFGKHGVLAHESGSGVQRRQQGRQQGQKQAPAQKPAKLTKPSKKARPGAAAQPRSAKRPANKPASPGTALSAPRKKPARAANPAAGAGANTSRRLTAPISGRLKGKRAAPKKKLNGYSLISALLGIACCVVFIACLTASVSTVALSVIDDILAIDSNSEIVTVVIPEGSDWEDIIDILSDSGIIRQKLICKMFAKFRHFNGYTKRDGTFKETEYLSGIYYIESDMGLEAIMNSMKANYGSTAETVKLSFPEGWSVAQIFEKLEKYEVCEAEKLYANLNLAAAQYDFFEDIPDKATRYLKCEGYLYPDTYEFYIGENANSVLKKLFNNFESKWIDDYAKRAKEIGYTMDQVLIIASILQREGSNKEQMKTISSIVHNRLDKSATYPQLQCDSTLNYANNYIVPYVDAYYGQLYSGSYNTYSTEGLPPGPICNPGDDAIYAALYPDDTGYYYFCHDKKGNMYVASTNEEQRANAALALG